MPVIRSREPPRFPSYRIRNAWDSRCWVCRLDTNHNLETPFYESSHHDYVRCSSCPKRACFFLVCNCSLINYLLITYFLLWSCSTSHQIVWHRTNTELHVFINVTPCFRNEYGQSLVWIGLTWCAPATTSSDELIHPTFCEQLLHQITWSGSWIGSRSFGFERDLGKRQDAQFEWRKQLKIHSKDCLS